MVVRLRTDSSTWASTQNNCIPKLQMPMVRKAGSKLGFDANPSLGSTRLTLRGGAPGDGVSYFCGCFSCLSIRQFKRHNRGAVAPSPRLSPLPCAQTWTGK